MYTNVAQYRTLRVSRGQCDCKTDGNVIFVKIDDEFLMRLYRDIVDKLLTCCSISHQNLRREFPFISINNKKITSE